MLSEHLYLDLNCPSVVLTFRHNGESGEGQLQDEELQEQSIESSGNASKERGGRNPATQTEKRGAGKHLLTLKHLITIFITFSLDKTTHICV